MGSNGSAFAIRGENHRDYLDKSDAEKSEIRNIGLNCDGFKNQSLLGSF